MSDRPVFHPDLGEYFAGLRKRRQWGQSHAVRKAQRLGLTHLTRQVLLRLERGKTKWPDPAVLREVAEIYEVPYTILLGEVIRHSYGVEPAQLFGETNPVTATSESDASTNATPDARATQIGLLTRELSLSQTQVDTVFVNCTSPKSL